MTPTKPELARYALGIADWALSAVCASPFRSRQVFHTEVPSGDSVVLDVTTVGPCKASDSRCADVHFAVSSDEPVDVFATAGVAYGADGLSGPWRAERVLCHSVAGQFPVDVQAPTLLLAARCRAPSGRACRFASAFDMAKLEGTSARAGSRISALALNPGRGNRPGRATSSKDEDAALHHHGPHNPCVDPTASFSAGSLQRVELEIGATRLFSIHGCGAQGSCSNVRFIATSQTAGGAGQLSWFVALSEEERQRAQDGNVRGFAVDRDAWTRSGTTCALESKGLVSPREAGDSVHFVLRCDHSSPVACVADVALSAVPLEASRLPVAMRSGMLASLEESQIRVVTAVQDPPTIARLSSGEWLAIPVGGCDAEACTLSIAAMSLACEGRATVVVQSSQQDDLEEFDLGKTAVSRTLTTRMAEDPARVLVQCIGGDDDPCHFAVSVAWKAANPSAVLRNEVPVVEARRKAGAKCTMATQCQSGGCRGGVCCVASEGSASSDCATCRVGSGVCDLRAVDLVAPPVDTCSGPAVDAMCGTARGGASFQCSQTGSPQLSSRTSGACLCGDSLRFWGTGAGQQAVPVCSERVALLRNASASAATAFAALQGNDEEQVKPGNDGGFAIAMGFVVGTVVFAGAILLLIRSQSTAQDDPKPTIQDAHQDVVLPHSPKPKSFCSIDPSLGHPPIMEVEEGEDEDSDGDGDGDARFGAGMKGTPYPSRAALTTSSYVVQMLDTSKQLVRQVEQSPSATSAPSRVQAKSRASSMSASCPVYHFAIPVMHTLRQAQHSSKAGSNKEPN